jgi:hypothetical protein
MIKNDPELQGNKILYELGNKPMVPLGIKFKGHIIIEIS